MRLIDADELFKTFKNRQIESLNWKECAILADNEESIIRADATLAFLVEVKSIIDNAPTVDLDERDADAFETGYIMGICETSMSKGSEDKINQEVSDMFGTKKEEVKEAAAAKVDYKITVESARTTKNDQIVMVDLDVNGVKIKSCMLKEATVTKDGEKYKKGDTCYFLNFPSEKVGDKYYNRVWFPVSNENLEDIIRQVQSLL